MKAADLLRNRLCCTDCIYYVNFLVVDLGNWWRILICGIRFLCRGESNNNPI